MTIVKNPLVPANANALVMNADGSEAYLIQGEGMDGKDIVPESFLYLFACFTRSFDENFYVSQIAYADNIMRTAHGKEPGMALPPASGSVWRHRKGMACVVLGTTCIDEGTMMDPLVIYMELEERTLWRRPMMEFLDGRFTPEADPENIEAVLEALEVRRG